MFTKREIIHLVISILILAFVFGFDDGNPSFVLNHWVINFLRFFLVVAIALLFRELTVKVFARRHDANSEYEIWNIKRVWFTGTTKLPRGFPFGIIIAFVLAIASRGNVFFTALGIHKLEENKVARAGRKNPTLNYSEEAQIVSMGILSSLFLAVVSIVIGKVFALNTTNFVTVNFFIALFNMIPLSNLDGAKIFFGSLLMYIFLLVFIVVSFLLIKSSIILGLVVALIMACLIAVLYFYKYGQ